MIDLVAWAVESISSLSVTSQESMVKSWNSMSKWFIENQSSIHVVAGDATVLMPLSSDGDVTHSCEDEWVCQVTGAIGQLENRVRWKLLELLKHTIQWHLVTRWAAVIRKIIPTTTANTVYILTITDGDQNIHDCLKRHCRWFCPVKSLIL